MPLLCCDVGLVSELRLTAGCVLMDLASPAVSGTSVYANWLICREFYKTKLPWNFEITGYRIKYGTVLWLVELQIRCGQKV